MIPAKVIGGGNNSLAQNVFKIVFSEALSSAPIYKAFDNSEVYPAVDEVGETTVKEAFTGTTGNGNKPEYALIDVTEEAPADADWMPENAVAGANNPNRLKGSVNYVICPVVPEADGEIKFNISAEFPYDSSVPSVSSQNILLEVLYQYTGTPPSLTYWFNEGTEEVPVWTQFTPGTHGIRPVNVGTVSGNYKYTLPVSSVDTVQELWVTAN